MNVSTPDVVARRWDKGEMPSKALWAEDTAWNQARELRGSYVWVVRTRPLYTRAVRTTQQRLAGALLK